MNKRLFYFLVTGGGGYPKGRFIEVNVKDVETQTKAHLFISGSKGLQFTTSGKNIHTYVDASAAENPTGTRGVHALGLYRVEGGDETGT